MAGKKEIQSLGFDDGVQIWELSSWRIFNKVVHRDMLEFPGYVFRGQGSSKWKILSSLDRLKNNTKETISADTHLKSFKKAIRGRRGTNPPPIKSNNDWWALGQHHGLATPLLDWTRSPFVALFFAFAEKEIEDDFRSVYAILPSQMTKKLDEDEKLKNKYKGFEIISPDSDENLRLINQSALFLKLPIGKDLESIVRTTCKGEKGIILLKIQIPNKDREDCLKNLCRMNINFQTLFPDLYGASMHSNLTSQIQGYDSLSHY